MTKFLKFKETLTKEVGSDLSEVFTNGLLQKTKGSEKKASEFYYSLGKVWGPLMRNWILWIKEKSRYPNISLILRDAKPLEVLESTKDWKRLYINRQNCGIPDELSGDNTHMHPLLKKYLEQNSCLDGFTFVDSGCYGSIVLELHKIGIYFQPLFFFSKNPSIPGFLNELGVNQTIGTILNDSLECAFPNVINRPEKFTEEHGFIKVDLCHADKLSVMFGKSALAGVKDSDCLNLQQSLSCITDLLEQSQNGSFTGIFSEASPEWSQKVTFLDNWPKKLCWK